MNPQKRLFTSVSLLSELNTAAENTTKILYSTALNIAATAGVLGTLEGKLDPDQDVKFLKVLAHSTVTFVGIHNWNFAACYGLSALAVPDDSVLEAQEAVDGEITDLLLTASGDEPNEMLIWPEILQARGLRPAFTLTSEDVQFSLHTGMITHDITDVVRRVWSQTDMQSIADNNGERIKVQLYPYIHSYCRIDNTDTNGIPAYLDLTLEFLYEEVGQRIRPQYLIPRKTTKRRRRMTQG
jgi:hypothetical protein